MLPLLRLLSIPMRTKPDLRTPVLGRHGHEGDVDYEREWRGRMREIGVRVGGLCGLLDAW